MLVKKDYIPIDFLDFIIYFLKTKRIPGQGKGFLIYKETLSNFRLLIDDITDSKNLLFSQSIRETLWWADK